MNILDYIPEGKENAVSRERLCELTGLSDRANRRLIQKERRKGAPILSSSRNKGYWLSNDPDEKERFVLEREATRKTETLTTAELRKDYYNQKGIKAVYVKGHFRRVGNGILDGQTAIGE